MARCRCTCALVVSVLLLVAAPAHAQRSLSQDAVAVTEDFDTFDGSGFAPIPSAGQLNSDTFIVTRLSDGSLSYGGAGTSGDFARGTSTGGETPGGIYAFETATGDFGLGVQPAGGDFTPGTIEAQYRNDTGGAITEFLLEYNIEVYNDQGRSQSFNASYASGTCGTSPGSFTSLSGLDFTTPGTADGSPSWTPTSRSTTVSSLNIADGDCLFIRFTSDDVSGSGSRDEIALDDLSVTPNPSGSGPGAPSVQFTTGSASVGEDVGTTSLDVEISNPDGSEVTVDVAFDSGNSTADAADVSSFSTTTVTFDASASDGDTETVDVFINDDDLFEGDRTAVFVLQNPSGANVASPTQYDLTITEDDSRLVISQYAESGSLKALEVWNVSGSSIDFGTTPLDVEVYSNGSPSATTDADVTSGTLPAGGVLVIGDATVTDAVTGADLEETDGVSFNGNDALELVLDGRREDVFGTIGNDPAGNSWDGNGVSTEDQNIQLLSTIRTGDQDGWTDPSTRFETRVDPFTGSGDLDGFGTAPDGLDPVVQFTASTGTVYEDAGTATLTAELLNGTGASVTVNVALNTGSSTAEASDLDGYSTTSLTFSGSPAARETETLVLTLTDDASTEGTETATFDLSVNSGSATLGNPTSLALTIRDNDPAGDIIITEVMQNPSAVGDANGEWFELYNTTNDDIDIQGWNVKGAGDSGNGNNISTSLNVPARGFAVICKNTDPAVNGGLRNCGAAESPALSNGEDGIVLLDDDLNEVDRVEWDDGVTWPDPSGASMVFTGTTGNNDGSLWTTATAREQGYDLSQSGDLGSPGRNGTGQILQPSATVSGSAGWRMLSLPFTAGTPEDLATANLVQGISGLPFSGGAANLYQWTGSNGSWTAPSSTTDLGTNGGGFIWYIFDTAATPVTDTPPFTLSVPGVPRGNSNVTASGLTDGRPFHLLGNPFTETFDLSELNLTGNGFSATVQVWDPNAGSYQAVTQASDNTDLIAPFQSFFVERASGSTTSLTFSAAGRRVDPQTPLARTPATTPTDTDPARIAFHLVGSDATGTPHLRDDALTLLAHPQASLGWDVWDASKLTPLTGQYATLAFQGTRADTTAPQAAASVPYPLPSDGATLPLALSTSNADAVETFTLSWPTWNRVPETWSLTLYDSVADSTIDLRETASYTFAASPSPTAAVNGPTDPLAAVQADALRMTASQEDEPPRFTLQVDAGLIPVELTRFQGTVAQDAALLEWTTASEQNNAGFEVQHRSASPADAASAWTSVGFVEGAGTTSQPQTYRFRTESLKPGRHTFRLRQVDLEGTATLSDTLSVRIRMQDAMRVEVAPNPVRQQGRATVQVRTPQPVTVALYDLLGRRLHTLHQGDLAAHRTHTFRLDAGSLPSGLYFLRVTGKHAQHTQRLTVVH